MPATRLGPDSLCVITMNHAHQSHYTDAPDPRIEHVLRGWNPNGGAHTPLLWVMSSSEITHAIRSWSGGRIVDGNSIFIFEIARMCIGYSATCIMNSRRKLGD